MMQNTHQLMIIMLCFLDYNLENHLEKSYNTPHFTAAKLSFITFFIWSESIAHFILGAICLGNQE